MPKHYAQGVNIQQGRIKYKGTKNMKIRYALQFDKVPMIKISAETTENLPNYRLYINKKWFRIKFTTPYNGEIVWEATL
jgi:hypothetical protein